MVKATNKESSYQRLKDRVAKLEEDIHTIVTNESSIESITLKMCYRTIYDTEGMFWLGIDKQS